MNLKDFPRNYTIQALLTSTWHLAALDDFFMGHMILDIIAQKRSCALGHGHILVPRSHKGQGLALVWYHLGIPSLGHLLA